MQMNEQVFSPEQIVVSLIFYEIIKLTEYPISSKLFSSKEYKEYITFLEINQNNNDLKSLNSIYLNKVENRQLYIIEYQVLMNILQSSKPRDIVGKLLTEQTVSSIMVDLKKVGTSCSDQTSFEELNTLMQNVSDHINTLNTDMQEMFFSNSDEYLQYFNELLEQQQNEYGLDNFLVGIPSGIDSLDVITKGFKRGEYSILAGRPSMGKTSLALDIVAHALRLGKSVLFFSLEMPAKDIFARLLPKIDRALSLNNTFMGQDGLQVKDRVLLATDFLRKSKFYIEDFSRRGNMTLSDISRVISIFEKRFGHIDLILLDYIQLMQSEGFKSQDENYLISNISKDIKKLCKKTKSPWLVLSQLSRKLEDRNDKRPKSSDLRGSGSLEQDADMIIFPYRETVYLEQALKEKLSKKPDNVNIAEALTEIREAIIERAEIIVAKNRNGPTGTAISQFHKPSASYVSVGLFSNQQFG